MNSVVISNAINTTTYATHFALSCPAGRYCGTAGATTADACLPCDAGEGGAAGSTSCSVCGAGSYSTGGEDCIGCPAGRYGFQEGAILADTCQECEPGKSSGVASLTCTACDAGKYRTATNSSCIRCEAGKYSGTVGADSASTCLACQTGELNPSGSTSPSSCLAPDHYVSDFTELRSKINYNGNDKVSEGEEVVTVEGTFSCLTCLDNEDSLYIIRDRPVIVRCESENPGSCVHDGELQRRIGSIQGQGRSNTASGGTEGFSTFRTLTFYRGKATEKGGGFRILRANVKFEVQNVRDILNYKVNTNASYFLRRFVPSPIVKSLIV